MAEHPRQTIGIPRAPICEATRKSSYLMRFVSEIIAESDVCYLPLSLLAGVRRLCGVVANSETILWEVDVQVDFLLPGGKLYVPGAERLIPNIQRLVDVVRRNGALLISSGDRHQPDDPEFKVFPPHCIRGTSGADVVPEGLAQNICTVPNDPAFQLPRNLLDHHQIFIEKQTLDVFDNPHTEKILEHLPPDAEFLVFGVVTEYCVRCAAKGLLKRGRRVSVITDASEQLDPAAGSKTIDELTAAGAKLITTRDALDRLGSAQRDA
jgi:nicotinamidase/pyrazinamidase